MTIKVTNDDVMAAAKACSNADGLMKKLPITEVGMRAALESFVARHSELAPQRPMYEPVGEAELGLMLHEIHYGTQGSWAGNVRSAGNGLLAGRAAPKREPVVVTEEMARECMKDTGWGGGCSRAILEAMNWLADRLNGKRGKPVDPRVAILRGWVWPTEPQTWTDDSIADLLVKLDEVKP